MEFEDNFLASLARANAALAIRNQGPLTPFELALIVLSPELPPDVIKMIEKAREIADRCEAATRASDAAGRRLEMILKSAGPLR